MAPRILKEVDPKTLKAWIDQDRALLIDVREPTEFAREHITGARLMPLSGFDPDDFAHEHDKIGVFHCRTGNRTGLAAQRLLATSFSEVYHLDGGLEGWKAAGLSVHVNKKAPIDIMRQVQITAGSLVVLGVALAALVSPWFLLLAGGVGAGLTYSGASGSCMMARMLGMMPWNRKAISAALGHAQTHSLSAS